MIATTQAPYVDVEHALRAGYWAWAVNPCKSPSYFKNLREDVERGPADPDMSLQDWIAQGILALKAAKRRLNAYQEILIDAYYLIPIDADARAKKDRACRQYGHHARNWIPLDLDYVIDVVRDWSGVRRIDERLWARRLGMSVRTLRRYRNGYGSVPGLVRMLNAQLMGAKGVAERDLRKDGLVLCT